MNLMSSQPKRLDLFQSIAPGTSSQAVVREPLYVGVLGLGHQESLKLTLYEKHYQNWKVSFTEKLVSGV